MKPFTTAILDACPPWLRRRVGGAVMRAMGREVERMFLRSVDSVMLRFPSAARPDVLGTIGAERRIPRGPGEESTTYADRLRTWLDAHRTRGGARSMLTQLYLYFRTSLSVPMEVLGNSGVRHLVDADGNMSRDLIDISGDGSGHWARIFVMIHLPSDTFPVPRLNRLGEPVLDGAGVPILDAIDVEALSAEDEARIVEVPRAWTAAHIECTSVTLFHSGYELWGYRDPEHVGPNVGTWSDDDPSPGQVWQGEDPARIHFCGDALSTFSSDAALLLITRAGAHIVTRDGRQIGVR